MIDIDGSQGEGGGQILRSALALAMATGQPFRICNIRAGRAKPGLMRQHLTCVQAAATICGAAVTGAAVGSREVTFAPGPIRAGVYHFPIGTAGGTSLVLQAVLPALLRAGGPSTLTIEGGTHNDAAPPFDFLDRALLPLLARAGASIRARLERHGFYPAGGGRVVINIDPPHAPRPLDLAERGRHLSTRAVAIVSRLPRSIAQRELDVLCAKLNLGKHEAELIEVPNPAGPGNAALVELRYDNVTEVFSRVGKLGTSAEQVAREVADDARDYIAARAPVGPYLADQLMVPLALLAGGSYVIGEPTLHARTNLEILKLFGVRAALSPQGVLEIPSG